MMRSLFALGACMVLLTGCAAATRQAAFPTRYTLTPAAAPPTSAPAAPPAGPAQVHTLRLARISAPPWLQGPAMYYRLAYRNANAIAAYADSTWAAAPADLLAPLIRDALGRSTRWRVVGAGVSARADATLSIQLEDFSQAFTDPRQSTGALKATATLVARPDGRLIAQRAFDLRAPAPTADAAGGVTALDAASSRFAAQLRQWLARQGTRLARARRSHTKP